MKRIFTLLVLLTAVVTMWAQTVEIDGIAYKLNSEDKTAKVESKNYAGDIVIPASVSNEGVEYSVTSIGNCAFRNRSGLTSVTIPNSVTSIGYEAFQNCSGLTSVTIGNSVTSIGQSAFNGCSGLTSVNISDIEAWCKISLANILANPLYYAHNLYLNGELVTDLTIPNSVTSIENCTFSGCSGLTSVTIPNSVTSIGKDAFYNCSSLPVIDGLRYADTYLVELVDKSLTDVTIKEGTRFIGSYAFSYCSGLTSVTFPNSVTSIDDYAFYQCIGLTSVTIPNSVTSIGNYAFQLCSGLTSVTIGNSVTSIGNWAFQKCSGLTSVNIFDIEAWLNIEFAGRESNPMLYSNNLFVNGQILTDLTLPSTMTSIKNYTFMNCRSLTSVTIPASVTSVGEYAFNGCQFKDVMVKNVAPATTSSDTFSDRSYQHASLYVPAGSWTDYVYGNGNWYMFNKIYETAQSVEAVSEAKAYMLMDDSFGYAVYDPINDKVSQVSSTSVDGSNPNHVWMMAEVQGKKYLYNLGARKFAVPNMDGQCFTLSETPSPVSAQDGENGIVLNGHDEIQWCMTDRAQMNAREDFEQIVNAIESVNANGGKVDAIYSLDGKRSNVNKGVRIIRYSDGTTKKVM